MYRKLYEIRDVVYGFIQLDQQEWDIINHPVYQRLRRIKQLALTDMVYPGAVHTRFEHSVGVMQMASDIFDSIISKKRTKQLLADRYGLDDSGLKRYRKVVRLAALLHDVGHSPFSHTGEDLMPLKEDGKRFKHEAYSIKIIGTYFRDLIETHPINSNFNIQVDEVTTLLGGDKSHSSFNGILILFKEIISGQLDADRADYLLRDSIHTGVSYGLYDRNRLINCIDLGQIEETNDLVLAIQEGGWHIAESLVLARYQMFSQVYFHKTRQAYDGHTSRAVKKILMDVYPQHKGCYPDLNHIEEYIQLDDWEMYGCLKKGQGGDDGDRIINRNHYRHFFATGMIPTDEELEEFEKKTEELKNSGVDYFISEVKTDWYKLDKDIWICNEDTGMVKVLSAVSPIVKSMVNAPRMKRLYVEKQWRDRENEHKRTVITHN